MPIGKRAILSRCSKNDVLVKATSDFHKTLFLLVDVTSTKRNSVLRPANLHMVDALLYVEDFNCLMKI